MISEERVERGRFNFLWALLLSIALHALVLPIAFWAAAADLQPLRKQPPQRELVVSSTSVRIEKRPVPQPRAPVPRPPAPHRAPPSRPVRPQPEQPIRHEERPRHELARTVPSAEPQPTAQPTQKPTQAPSLQQQIAQQEREFSKETAQLNARNNPLSIATSAPERPAAYRRSAFDAPGQNRQDEVQAVLIPLRHWYERGLSCYYTRYVAQFASGGSEDGEIPWPVCYPQDDDRMAHPSYPHNLPIPVPQPNYVLPPGTYLTPLLRSVYRSRLQPNR